jgi:cell division transport system ATP-binding protein
MKLFEQFNQVGTTVIVASHDRDLIESMGVRIIELDQGVIVRDGIDTRLGDRSVNHPIESGRGTDG